MCGAIFFTFITLYAPHATCCPDENLTFPLSFGFPPTLESISFVGVGEGEAKLLYRFVVTFQRDEM